MKEMEYALLLMLVVVVMVMMMMLLSARDCHSQKAIALLVGITGRHS
jgi:uncharacterized protein (UPF0333 family)